MNSKVYVKLAETITSVIEISFNIRNEVADLFIFLSVDETRTVKNEKTRIQV